MQLTLVGAYPIPGLKFILPEIQLEMFINSIGLEEEAVLHIVFLTLVNKSSHWCFGLGVIACNVELLNLHCNEEACKQRWSKRRGLMGIMEGACHHENNGGSEEQGDYYTIFMCL